MLKNKALSRTFLAMTLTLISIVLFSSSCGSKANPVTTKVTVVGESSLDAAPDAAVMVFTVVTQSSQALEAQQQNAGKGAAVIKAVKDLAGADTEIKTSSYSLQPQNDYRDNKLPKIVGYEARNSLTVTISDLTKVGSIIDAATRAGANSIDRVSFILKDNKAISGQVLSTATGQAMAKARSIAEAMGGRVSRLVEEQETATVGPGAGELNDMVTYSIRAPKELMLQAGPIKLNSRVQLIVEVEAHP